jgi:hypothetical protein
VPTTQFIALDYKKISRINEVIAIVFHRFKIQFNRFSYVLECLFTGMALADASRKGMHPAKKIHHNLTFGLSFNRGIKAHPHS